MVDRLGAAVAVLVFLLGVIVWRQFTDIFPVQVPIEVTLIAVIVVAIGSLLAYARLSPSREW